MEIQFILNKKQVTTEAGPDAVLLNVLRDLGCKSVKCGCDTANCGLCTVWIDGKSRLSCSVLAASVAGHEVTTMEGVEKEAARFGEFLAAEGAEQCGFCSPGFIMNVLAMFRELENPTVEEIKEYLAGNLCRCTGYMGQLRAIQKYMEAQKEPAVHCGRCGDGRNTSRYKDSGQNTRGGALMSTVSEKINAGKINTEKINAGKNSTERIDVEKLRVVNRPVPKVDAPSLVTGKAVYTNDLAPADCLIVKVLRSPHAHALIRDINTVRAEAVPGIECILTYKDCPDKRFTMAGQTYPEPSPYDRLILDQRVRFVGDAVAIIAGTSEDAVKKAMKLIKVKYEVLEPVLDFRKAKDNPILIHPEENWRSLCPVGADNKRNLCAHGVHEDGDIEAVLASCDHVVDRVYHTKANQQAMMETFRTYTYLDTYGRLNIVSSTQVPFHVRRILANALDIPKSKVRVVKPRIGGGFGAKQTSVCEVYPAIVTWKTGKPAKIIYTREESLIASSPRHEMEMYVRLGADKEGNIKGIDLYTLSNTGAFGEHGPTTVGLSAHKSIPLYGKAEAFRFTYDVVYTNVMSSGAYRGYGATQGIFAVESAVNELAQILGMDPTVLREKNMVREGQVMPAYYGEKTKSCALDRCLERAKEMIGWDEKYPCRDMGNGKVRGVGVAMAMQGSGISGVDTGSVAIKVNDDGFYSLMIGATDMGTGCDTILSQMAAECLDCEMDEIIVSGVDTDTSPYDCGSYASSTTYVTGMAVVRTCETLRAKICERGAEYMGCSVDDVEFDGQRVTNLKTGESISRKDIGNKVMCFNNASLSASEAFSSPTSPPPFMVGIAEVEIDKETGVVELTDYAAVVDCGTVVNPSLARVQTEGGIAQGIGMALYEDVVYSAKGKNYSNSFMQYKIPSRLDVGNIRVEFESSYEPTGPFGAKSIGEIVINTPCPAISNAIQNAVGVIIRELPMTAEKVYRGMQESTDLPR